MAYSSHGGAYSAHGGGSSVQGQTLEMNVVGCYNLSNKEWFSRQDPYVVIEYAGQKFRTRTDTDGGRNPSFNETFKLALIEGLREVNASVWNSNTFERDDYIGSTKIILNKVIDTGYDDTQWSLTNSRTGKSSGSLKLILHYAASARTKPGKPEGSYHGHGAPPAPMYGAPPTPMYSAPPAPMYSAPPAPMYSAPPAPMYSAPPPPMYSAPPAPMYSAQPAPAPAYGPAYGVYPPQQPAMPYPPPTPGYGHPPAPMGAVPAYPARPPPPAAYYPQASAPPPPYGGPPTYPPQGYPPPSGYPQNNRWS